MLRKFLCRGVNDETRAFLERAPLLVLLAITMMATTTSILTRKLTSIICAVGLTFLIFILKLEKFNLQEYVSPHIIFAGIIAESITAIINLYIRSNESDIGTLKIWGIRVMYYLIIPVETITSMLLVY